MKKQIYWLVESNGDLSVTIKDISEDAILEEIDPKKTGNFSNIEIINVIDFDYPN